MFNVKWKSGTQMFSAIFWNIQVLKDNIELVPKENI